MTISDRYNYLLDKREHTIAIRIKLLDQHVTVCLRYNQAVVSEEGVEVQGVDVLLGILINATEGIEHHQGVVLREDLLLHLTLSDTLSLF